MSERFTTPEQQQLLREFGKLNRRCEAMRRALNPDHRRVQNYDYLVDKIYSLKYRVRNFDAAFAKEHSTNGPLMRISGSSRVPNPYAFLSMVFGLSY
ncbi:unnamed protein product [Caenorhabditis bovis]|uniref:Uncharacterized protein n=1 Tax=Caenorhabditis bovis TaxID=2654633 RepID=A0A8S1FCN7_9PELO|nr:unnamed protein product [Caenorhabditis bovis]